MLLVSPPPAGASAGLQTPSWTIHRRRSICCHRLPPQSNLSSRPDGLQTTPRSAVPLVSRSRCGLLPPPSLTKGDAGRRRNHCRQITRHPHWPVEPSVCKYTPERLKFILGPKLAFLRVPSGQLVSPQFLFNNPLEPNAGCSNVLGGQYCPTESRPFRQFNGAFGARVIMAPAQAMIISPAAR